MVNVVCPECRSSDNVIERKAGLVLDHEDEVIVSDKKKQDEVVSEYLIDCYGCSIGKAVADDALVLKLYECNFCKLIFGIDDKESEQRKSTIEKFKDRLKKREKSRSGRD